MFLPFLFPSLSLEAPVDKSSRLPSLSPPSLFSSFFLLLPKNLTTNRISIHSYYYYSYTLYLLLTTNHYFLHNGD